MIWNGIGILGWLALFEFFSASDGNKWITQQHHKTFPQQRQLIYVEFPNFSHGGCNSREIFNFSSKNWATCTWLRKFLELCAFVLESKTKIFRLVTSVRNHWKKSCSVLIKYFLESFDWLNWQCFGSRKKIVGKILKNIFNFKNSKLF